MWTRQSDAFIVLYNPRCFVPEFIIEFPLRNRLKMSCRRHSIADNRKLNVYNGTQDVK